jgi:hypothetical protein
MEVTVACMRTSNYTVQKVGDPHNTMLHERLLIHVWTQATDIII